MIDLIEIYEPREPTWTWECAHRICYGDPFSLESFLSMVSCIMPDRYAYGNDGIYLVEATQK